jgi:hypothetical protein
MASVSNEALAKWWPAFERNARRFDGLGGAEFDDLVQEQAEAAWIQMEEGYYPSALLLERACLTWIQYVSHRGLVYDEHPFITWMHHDDEDANAYRTDL